MRKMFKELFLFFTLGVVLFFSSCASPSITGLLVTNKTSNVLRLDVYDPINRPPDQRTVYSGGTRLVTHQKVSSTWFGCKAELADVAMTIHFSNGVAIAYNRDEILRHIQWDSKECVWRMDVSMTPISAGPVLGVSPVGLSYSSESDSSLAPSL